MIQDLLMALREAGVSVDDSIATQVEVAVRAKYGGERVYIQSLPKLRRAVAITAAQMALGTGSASAKAISAATGIPVRTVKWLKNGR